MQLSPSRPAVGPATVEVSLFDTSGAPVKGAGVEVEGNMSHAGMVPVLARAEEAGDGRYLSRDFRFTMAGDWNLIVRADIPGGGKAARSFAVSGVTAGAAPAATPTAER
jgi:hypothetical protein